MISVAIIGAGGRMGQALARCISRDPGLKLVAAIDSENHPNFGDDVGALAGIDKLGVKISSDLGVVAGADVIVDFTLATAAKANIRAAVEARRPLVIGTTGLGEAEKDELAKASMLIPVVSAPNMSLGVNLLFAMVKQAAGVLGMAYRAEIDETHHVHKKDAPSGTALRLGEKVAEGRKQNFKEAYLHQTGELTEEIIEHPEDKIVIHSHREGEVVGDHTVSFGNNGETIELTHHAWNREAFALGALHAAKWVVSRKPGLYDMQDVLGL